MTTRLALVPFDGQPPANAELTFGSTEEFFADLKVASARRAYEQQLAARERAVMMQGIEQSNNASMIRRLAADAIPRLMGLLDELVTAKEAQHRQDAERAAEQQQQDEAEAQHRRIRDAVRALQDDNPDTWGELAAKHPPTEAAREEELAAGDGDGEGDLPRELQLGTQPEARNPAISSM
jgi:hypothetical protein